MSEYTQTESWFDDPLDDASEGASSLPAYDITASPNDFNVSTLFDFINRGAIEIPAFQRNYVWDIKKASSLIESIIMGIPIPQLFLYEKGKNKYLVIDGQQRLMSIYYFMRKRFPRMEARPLIRRIAQENNGVPDEILFDNKYFTDFSLNIPPRINGVQSPLNGNNYSTLGDHLFSFEMKTIRNVIVRQALPAEDDSSIYEIFNRLNATGVTLTAQEIRMSLYHSEFYQMLERVNGNLKWRVLLGIEQPDLHMKDIEVILRGFAMSMMADQYSTPMSRFLNMFSKSCLLLNTEQVQLCEKIFLRFVDEVHRVSPDVFRSAVNLRFNISLFEAVMAAICDQSFRSRSVSIGSLDERDLTRLKTDAEFQLASQSRTSSKANVRTRLSKAKEHLFR